MPNTVPLSLEAGQSIVELSLEHRMREADVGSQSADTTKLGFSSGRGQRARLASSFGLARPPRDGDSRVVSLASDCSVCCCAWGGGASVRKMSGASKTKSGAT